MNMIVEHGGEKVVRRAYRVEIACEVQIDVLHRYDLRVTPARRAAFNAEHRPERRLAESGDNVFAYPFKSVGKPYRGGCFTLSRGRGRDCRHENEFTFPFFVFKIRKVYFRLVFSVIFHAILVDSEFRGDFGDFFHFTFARDFYVGFHFLIRFRVCHLFPPSAVSLMKTHSFSIPFFNADSSIA